jgi:hypothetical protein
MSTINPAFAARQFRRAATAGHFRRNGEMLISPLPAEFSFP